MANEGYLSLQYLVILSIVFRISCKADREDGGWWTDKTGLIADAGPCNVEVRDASLTQEEFLQKYANKAPVIIKGVTDNSNFKKLCSKDNLLSSYGDKMIRLSSANTYSYKKVDVSLNKYVNEILKPQPLGTPGSETLYWFGDNNFTEWESFFEKYNEPPFKQPKHTGVYSFGLAGAGTGVPFHFHGPGFAEVIYGRKRWFLYPPHQEPVFNPDKTTLDWLLNEYTRLPVQDMPYECTMRPGEVIYFPDRWWHCTLNIDTSVFISTFLAP